MVNKKYIFDMSRMGRKAFQEYIKQHRKSYPEAVQIPECAAIPPSKWIKDSDLPFVVGDRVQVVSGEHKNKVGRIVQKEAIGNAYKIEGIPGKAMVYPAELLENEEESPVIKGTTSFDYTNLRLVSKIKREDGTDEDVAVHSLSLGKEVYDKLSNTYIRERFATHDPSIVIPYPLPKAEPVDPSKSSFATAPEVVDQRTFYPSSVNDMPLPIYALTQITNIHNRYKRHRYAPRITGKVLAAHAEPVMPVPPQTKELLEKMRSLPRPEKIEFTPEIEEFLGNAVQRGLQDRRAKELENWKEYV